MAFRKLYAPIRPYSSGYIQLDAENQMYWEQSGNPDGVPVLVLHGGPGAGASPDMRRFFDARYYRIVLFDQRGCGRSTPSAVLSGNTPLQLVADIETLRTQLRIERWHLFGGSWGATLALRYAIACPERVAGMVLRSVFLLTRAEIDWFVQGMQTVFPEVWRRFADAAGNAHNLLDAYIAGLENADESARLKYGVAWASYEAACSTLYPHYKTFALIEEQHAAFALARLETHYFKQFAEPDDRWVMDKIDRFRHIPTAIVQGRYDMITPMHTAYRLHKSWPEADFVVVPDGAHSAFESPMRDRLIAATDNACSIRW